MNRIIAFAVALSFLFAGCRINAVKTNTSEDKTEYIIIDAGHGGFDGGAVAKDGTEEKNINLAIALKLGKMLKLCGKNVIYTRTEDTALNTDGKTVKGRKTSDMKYRHSLTKIYENSVFISIHQNKFTSSAVKGAQVFYSAKFETAERLANLIQNNISEFVQPYNHRTPKKADKNIYLLYNAEVPSLIVECAFISNTQELKLIKDGNYQNQIAFCILKSLL